MYSDTYHCELYMYSWVVLKISNNRLLNSHWLVSATKIINSRQTMNGWKWAVYTAAA